MVLVALFSNSTSQSLDNDLKHLINHETQKTMKNSAAVDNTTVNHKTVLKDCCYDESNLNANLS